MILRQAVNFAGRIYPAGEDVRGKMPLDFIQLLQQSGVIDADETAQTPVPEDTTASVEGKTLAELNLLAASITEAVEIEALLAQEQNSAAPRAGAVKILEQRHAKLKSQASGNLPDA